MLELKSDSSAPEDEKECRQLWLKADGEAAEAEQKAAFAVAEAKSMRDFERCQHQLHQSLWEKRKYQKR